MSKAKVSFEESLQSLESIGESLESGQLSLEDSIKAFEEGMQIGKNCQKTLKDAELKIEKLMDDHNTMIEVSQDELR